MRWLQQLWFRKNVWITSTVLQLCWLFVDFATFVKDVMNPESQFPGCRITLSYLYNLLLLLLLLSCEAEGLLISLGITKLWTPNELILVPTTEFGIKAFQLGNTSMACDLTSGSIDTGSIDTGSIGDTPSYSFWDCCCWEEGEKSSVKAIMVTRPENELSIRIKMKCMWRGTNKQIEKMLH